MSDQNTKIETEAKPLDGGGFTAPICSESPRAIGACTCGPCVRGEPCKQVQTHIAIEVAEGAVAHVSPDAPASLMDALGQMVAAAKEHFSPHARFARRLRELGDDARTERMHILADVCDEMAEKLEADSCIPNDKLTDGGHKTL